MLQTTHISPNVITAIRRKRSQRIKMRINVFVFKTKPLVKTPPCKINLNKFSWLVIGFQQDFIRFRNVYGKGKCSWMFMNGEERTIRFYMMHKIEAYKSIYKLSKKLNAVLFTINH